MKSGKTDRRVKYTKMVLKESFIDLLERKDISQITIKEICENADINRATFYAHYADQYDLLKKIENELLEEIGDHFEVYYSADSAGSMDEVQLAESIFQYLMKNARLCKLLLSERGDFSFQKKVMTLVYDKIIAELTDNNRISKEDAEYVYSFTISGCVGMVQKWFNEGQVKSPRYMAEMVINLTTGLINMMKSKSMG